MRTSPQPTRVCGCVPFRRTKHGIELLVVRNIFGEPHWEFPKGAQEVGETDEETALRELREETGLTGTLGSALPEEHYVRKIPGTPAESRTLVYFLCEIAANKEPILAEDEVDAYRWCTPEEATALVTYESMKRVAHAASSRLQHTD